MLREIILEYTNPGDVVVVPNLHDGSILIAAETTGRICVGVDQDPYSVDVSARRWQDVTGKDAFDLKSGEPLDELTVSL